MALFKKAPVARQGLASLELIERALHLLRHAPPSVHGAFWCGGVPYALSLLYFWSDMSRGAMAETRLAAEALLLALAHLWMRVWQARACSELAARLRSAPAPVWRVRDYFAEAGLQLRWGVWTWLLLPLASLALLPFAGLYAFYQNLVAAPGAPRERVVVARQLATLWPWQSHMLLVWFLLFRFIVFIEVFSCLLVLPWLGHLLFGLDHVATRYPWWFLNTTVLCLTLVMTHLLLDPLLKTVYTLRCFHGAAVTSGVDLLTEWRALRARRLEVGAGGATALTLALVLALLPVALPASESASEPPPGPPPAAHVAVSATRIDEMLTIVMARPEFAWRMPRDINETTEDNWLARQLRYLKSQLTRLGSWLREIVEDFFDWLQRRFGVAPRPPRAAGAVAPATLNAVIYGLIALLLAAGGFLYWRGRRRRRVQAAVAVERTPLPVTPDMDDEKVTAMQLPEEEWLELAAKWRHEGDFRRASRAYFLAILARLARLGYIRVQPSKSNRDYLYEVLRRALGATAGTERFASVISIFERGWYGEHPVTDGDLDTLRESVDTWS